MVSEKMQARMSFFRRLRRTFQRIVMGRQRTDGFS
jgi:hypothetical protein